jgi:hypothetical protein
MSVFWILDVGENLARSTLRNSAERKGKQTVEQLVTDAQGDHHTYCKICSRNTRPSASRGICLTNQQLVGKFEGRHATLL